MSLLELLGDAVTSWTLVVVLLLVVLGWYLVWTASRVDRLHHRVVGARAALENQLLRRATAAGELASAGLLDPASSLLLAGAAAEALAHDDDATTLGTANLPDVVAGREQAESDLSRALRAALEDADLVASLRGDRWGSAFLDTLAAACHRVALARRFYNDAVSQARRVRAKRVVRWARLAGRAGALVTFEMDDVPPAGIRR